MGLGVKAILGVPEGQHVSFTSGRLLGPWQPDQFAQQGRKEGQTFAQGHSADTLAVLFLDMDYVPVEKGGGGKAWKNCPVLVGVHDCTLSHHDERRVIPKAPQGRKRKRTGMLFVHAGSTQT
jgi:hypothetical protein